MEVKCDCRRWEPCTRQLMRRTNMFNSFIWEEQLTSHVSLEAVIFNSRASETVEGEILQSPLLLWTTDAAEPPTEIWPDCEDSGYFNFIQAMSYSDDIEMWDFENILDNSPLTALTADFARFKQRFSKIFGSDSSIPFADSDSETASMASTTSRSNHTTQSTETTKDTVPGSTQYRPQPAKRNRDMSKNKLHRLSHFNKHQENKYQEKKYQEKKHRENRHQENNQKRHTEKNLLKCIDSAPAKRPTDLPVIPHIITDEYLAAMKTKGYCSADPVGRPRDHIQVYPRLTQSYLEQYHNSQSDTSPDQTVAIHDWQFKKHQGEAEEFMRNSCRPKEGRHDVRFGVNYLQSPSSSLQASESESNGLVGAYLNHDNKLFKEDSWKGPSTPHPNKNGAGASLGATHRGTHRFVPRHSDEMPIEIGDSIHVLDEAEDGWCMGINLTSQVQGLFPSVYATDLEFYEVNSAAEKQPATKLYKLHFLGSMEVNHHKGSDVLIDAIEKIILNRRLSKDTTTPPLCQIEVSDAGIKMIDLTHKKRTRKLITDINVDSASERLSKLLAFSKETKAVSNHFFSLKNVSFCGYHPDNPRYFGFITKHPTQKRFACHCYSSIDESTQPIVDAVGDSFHNYYCGSAPPLSNSSEDFYFE